MKQLLKDTAPFTGMVIIYGLAILGWIAYFVTISLKVGEVFPNLSN